MNHYDIVDWHFTTVLTACVSVFSIAVTGSFEFADSVETWNLSPHHLLFESRTLSTQLPAGRDNRPIPILATQCLRRVRGYYRHEHHRKGHLPPMIISSARCYHGTTVDLMANFGSGPRLRAPQLPLCRHHPRRGCAD